MSLRQPEHADFDSTAEDRFAEDESLAPVSQERPERHSVMPRPSLVPPRTRRAKGTSSPRTRHAAKAPESLPARSTKTRRRRPVERQFAADELLAIYTPLVRQIASGFQRKLPRNVLRDDLIAAGMSGLWDAILRYGDKANEGFEWYVRVRIRGAILDELRAQDWLPRRVRAAAQKTDGGPPSVVRFDDVSEWEQRRCLSTGDLPTSESEVDAKFTQETLARAIDQLPTRERLIVAEHYFRGVKFKDLGVQLGVSEPRISQLHSRAMAMLRTLMSNAA
jgi:RNA polymerase sigma factor for flagellar operon FliA